MLQLQINNRVALSFCNRQFKNEINSAGSKKSGLPYEKGLISDHLEKETFSDEEKEFIKNIIYPKRENSFEVDDAFGIFIAYEITIDDNDKRLSNSEFRKKLQLQIKEEISNRLQHIEKKIDEYKLFGHKFYIYIVPFTELTKRRSEIQKEITR